MFHPYDSWFTARWCCRKLSQVNRHFDDAGAALLNEDGKKVLDRRTVSCVGYVVNAGEQYCVVYHGVAQAYQVLDRDGKALFGTVECPPKRVKRPGRPSFLGGAASDAVVKTVCLSPDMMGRMKKVIGYGGNASAFIRSAVDEKLARIEMEAGIVYAGAETPHPTDSYLEQYPHLKENEDLL